MGSSLISLLKSLTFHLDCSAIGAGATCQTQIFGIDTGGGVSTDSASSSVYVYNLNVVGATSMVDRQDMSLARFSDNVGNFPSCVALFKTKGLLEKRDMDDRVL